MKEISYSYEPIGQFKVGDVKKFSDGLFRCVKIEKAEHQDKCHWEVVGE